MRRGDKILWLGFIISSCLGGVASLIAGRIGVSAAMGLMVGIGTACVSFLIFVLVATISGR
jgi:hypothetical protein